MDSFNNDQSPQQIKNGLDSQTSSSPPPKPNTSPQVTKTSRPLFTKKRKLFFAITILLLFIAIGVLILITYSDSIDTSLTDNIDLKPPDNTISVTWLQSTVEIDKRNFPSSESYQVDFGSLPVTATIPNDLDYIDSVNLEIINQRTNETVTEIDRPITYIYDYSQVDIAGCEYEESSISAYVYDDTHKEIIRLDSLIDTNSNKLTASLPNLYPNDYNGNTQLLVLIPGSRFLIGCGDDARAYLENDRLIMQSEGYSIVLPDTTQRPKITYDYSSRANIPLLPEVSDTYTFEVLSQQVDSNISPEEYREVEYAYGSMILEPLIRPEATIISQKQTSIANQPALTVTTQNENGNNYYTFIGNPNKSASEEFLVYAFVLTSTSETSESTFDQVKARYEDTINSIQFTTPRLE